MPTAIKYDSIHLYSRYASIDSAALRKLLTDNNIAFTELSYKMEAVAEAITPLNTWFEGVTFNDMPIIVFDAVYWEAVDGSDRYGKRQYAIDSNGLPSDFTKLAVKNT